MSRQERVVEAIKKEVSLILHDELKDPRLGFVTVTRVEIAPDLRFAKVFYSVLGKEEDYAKTKAALDSALGFIRRQIAQRVKLRYAVELMFNEDRSTEYSVRIEEILNEIKAAATPEPAPLREARKRIRKGGKGEPKQRRRAHKKK